MCIFFCKVTGFMSILAVRGLEIISPHRASAKTALTTAQAETKRAGTPIETHTKHHYQSHMYTLNISRILVNTTSCNVYLLHEHFSHLPLTQVLSWVYCIILLVSLFSYLSIHSYYLYCIAEVLSKHQNFFTLRF